LMAVEQTFEVFKQFLFGLSVLVLLLVVLYFFLGQRVDKERKAASAPIK